jgi:hypothetical protein
MSDETNPYWVGYHQGKAYGQVFYRWAEILDRMPDWIAADSWRSREWRVGFYEGNWQARHAHTEWIIDA